ncbi:MAG TPA: ABC transporter substrate-binding protein [Burkholderiales bacterium]|nr:ABC transporter substrate-binding protein [Burkholderiales bacterium]
MKRRDVVLLGVLAAASPASLAQPVRIPRIGVLAIPPLPQWALQMEALSAGLRQRGYVEGKNLVLEVRSANGRYESLRALADELVAAKVDVIVAFGTPPSQAAKAATTTIPIVMAGVGDPIGTGLVSSLARPGGNLTGTSNISPPLVVKRLELLKECLPDLRRVALFANPSNPAQAATIRAVESASLSLKLELRQYAVRSLDDIRGAFASMRADRVEALVLGNDPLLITHAAAIAEMAKKEHVRSAGNREFAESGGLIGYGSVNDVLRHAATYVDKILKGANPGDLPIEQPSKYEVFLNLKTAKAADFAIPPSFRLLRVDRVIE